MTSTIDQSTLSAQKTKAAYGWYAVWILLVAILAVVGFKLYQVTLGPIDSGSAPTFTMTTFDGQNFDLAAQRGKVVVVNFWASWCDPCKEEALDLQAFHNDYKDRGVVVIGVDYVDTETEAKTYLGQFNITYLNGPDLGTKISQAYRIKGVPETYIVGPDGNLVTNIIGPTTKENLARIVEPLLK
jgi:cytochrome c biogenesis protein CcmG/thiol:disulfide interchange protein DsbE